MRVLPFVIPKASKQAFTFQEDRESIFYERLHQHPELQLSYIFEGQGTLFAGQNINPFNKGQLIVIGSNVPHVFKSDASNSDLAHRFMIFVDPQWLTQFLLDVRELANLEAFVRKSESGFIIDDQNGSLAMLVEKIQQSEGLERFKACLDLFAVTPNLEAHSLNSAALAAPYKSLDNDRMSAVIDFVLNNYDQDISLDHVAQKAALTRNAFCKYFKKRTLKTFTEFLNEVRIESATRMLSSQKDMSISQVASNVGYSNLSYFNRKFKSIKGVTPKYYKQLAF